MSRLFDDRGSYRLTALQRTCARCGHVLACWCPPGSPCHADVLLAVANGWEVPSG